MIPVLYEKFKIHDQFANENEKACNADKIKL